MKPSLGATPTPTYTQYLYSIYLFLHTLYTLLTIYTGATPGLGSVSASLATPEITATVPAPSTPTGAAATASAPARTSPTASPGTAPVFVLPAGWGLGVTSHVGGASMGLAVSTIVRKVLSNLIS